MSWVILPTSWVSRSNTRLPRTDASRIRVVPPSELQSDGFNAAPLFIMCGLFTALVWRTSPSRRTYYKLSRHALFSMNILNDLLISSKDAWEVARSLVVGYIEEDDEEEDNSDSESDDDDNVDNGRSWSIRSHFTAMRRNAERTRPELGQGSVSARDPRSSSSLRDSSSAVGGRDLYTSSSVNLSNESNTRAAMIAKAWVRKVGL